MASNDARVSSISARVRRTIAFSLHTERMNIYLFIRDVCIITATYLHCKLGMPLHGSDPTPLVPAQAIYRMKEMKHEYVSLRCTRNRCPSPVAGGHRYRHGHLLGSDDGNAPGRPVDADC